VTLDRLAQSVRRSVAALDVIPRVDDLPKAIARSSSSGDVVVLLGAGSIGSIHERVLEALRGGVVPEAGA